MEMKCKYCGGLVLWDWPVNGFNDHTTCQDCGGTDCQIIEYLPITEETEEDNNDRQGE